MCRSLGGRLTGGIGVLTAALVLAGCGGPDEPPSPQPTPPVASSTAVGPSATPARSASPIGSATATPASSPTLTASPTPTASPTTAAGEPSTPVPPSATGGIDQTVAPRRVETRAPVELDETSTPRAGVAVRLAAVLRVTATAKLPGEVSGPALAVTVSVANTSDGPMRLADVVVNLDDASGAPASAISSPPARALPLDLPAGRTTEGVYVFTVAGRRQGSVTVTVSLAPDQPVLLFRGRVR